MTPMKELLLNAKTEINTLRRDNEILRAKVEVMDLFAVVLHTAPARFSQGAAPDVAWALQKEIDKIEAEKQEPARGRPTVEELEKILQQRDERPIDILPDGSIRART